MTLASLQNIRLQVEINENDKCTNAATIFTPLKDL
jgi:hypothetical protein